MLLPGAVDCALALLGATERARLSLGTTDCARVLPGGTVEAPRIAPGKVEGEVAARAFVVDVAGRGITVSVGSPVSGTTPASLNIGTIGGAGIASLCPDAASREGMTNLWGIVGLCAGVAVAVVPITVAEGWVAENGAAAGVTNRLCTTGKSPTNRSGKPATNSSGVARALARVSRVAV